MQPLSHGNIRLAATVVLLRDTVRGPEVFMTKRPGGAVFPDLHVFPGGKVDESDFAPEVLAGLEADHADGLLGLAAGGLRYWVAAIRECFEECGVLLAYRDGALVRWRDRAEMERFHHYRQRLIDGELSMTELCRHERLRLAADRVFYFSHWITPEVAPKRFDTRFFVAAMPEAQQTVAHQDEIVDDVWIRPADALSAHAAGDWQMIAPTLTTLSCIAAYPTTEHLLAAVRAESHLDGLTDSLRQQGMHELR
jgi:8-oxo-dGTP pyrophosphatase MutT (NUDIX family)